VTKTPRLLIGWREWVALPGLGLPAVKAKVDTGARTSSIHAFQVEAFVLRSTEMVRFRIHPLQFRKDIIVTCEAPIVDYRAVTDSGGHREKRFVIETDMKIGELFFPIELTLANRETMSHRMLIGRSAMKHFMIDPPHEFLLGQPEKVSRLYKQSKMPLTKTLSSRHGKNG
jgi:hypothetical protein